jgi:hypothetical protein
MQIVQTFPPNIEQLKKFFPINAETHPIFTYGETIHAPYHEHIPPDIIEHEQFHIKQQKLFTSPDVWWNKYILDKSFRCIQEVEAYAHQYQWIKKQASNKVAKEALFEMASNLSSPLYQLDITHNEAEVAIKRYGKTTT